MCRYNILIVMLYVYRVMVLVYTVMHVSYVCILKVYCVRIQDMLCFSGSGMLSIKAGNFPAHQRRQQVTVCSVVCGGCVSSYFLLFFSLLQGYVVGFCGPKVFSLHYVKMSLIDAPQVS